MSTIPARKFVTVLPNVINAGGNALDIIAIVLTTSTRVPTNSYLSFPTPAAVGQFFGLGSKEYAFSVVYFAGFTGRTATPGSIVFVQYPATPVAAYLQSGSVAGLGLPAIQAMNGTLTVVVDGYTHTASSLNLSGATSFSAAAALIQAGLTATEPTEASFTGAIAGTTLTVSTVASGTVSVGQTVVGASVTAGTTVIGLGTGSGLTGTYTVSAPQTVTSESMTAVATAPTVAFDSISGSFIVTSGITGAPSTAAFATGSLAASLLMTQATGAVLSQGEAYEDPATFMTSVVALTQDFAVFTTLFDPDNGAGNTQKMAFAGWTNGQSDRFAYVCWDHDVTPTQSPNAAASLGQLLKAGNYSGTILVWEPTNLYHAAFVCGWAASINFAAKNGRATLAYRGQSGLIAGVTNETVADNLEANGYNYIGAVATANQDFVFAYPGSVSGPFEWADSYVNQIWFNNALQLALMELETQVGTIPYNAAGYALIEAACADPIAAALNNGVIAVGVPLSEEQAAEINNAAGVAVDKVIESQGYYLQVLAASPQVRQARTSPPISLWYTDGESVQQITLNSNEVQ